MGGFIFNKVGIRIYEVYERSLYKFLLCSFCPTDVKFPNGVLHSLEINETYPMGILAKMKSNNIRKFLGQKGIRVWWWNRL